ncbi:MAG TPA: phosphoribosyltransferase family protein, partial [Polyangiaceae bacterium]|nr:phosphoribosyltransferase family protein [Polyangiaceae bacterium]
RTERMRRQLVQLAKQSSDTARRSPHMVVGIFKNAVQVAPELASRLKEDVTAYRESRRAKKEPRVSMDAAAE